ncbi:19101_t:CDS:1, partial [Rhizophagus irregularis]
SSEDMLLSNLLLEKKILESPQCAQCGNKADFSTLKVLVLNDIDKRQNESIEHRITKIENQSFFLIVGASLTV